MHCSGYAFDYIPHHFFKELLVHEAHRHPYIEQLAQMYLMRLRHRENFVTEAGSAWRQLMVMAIFPWLENHRIFVDERRQEAEQEAEDMEGKQQREAKRFQGFKDMNDGVVHAAGTGTNEVLEIGNEVYGATKDVVDEVGRTGKDIAGMAGLIPKQKDAGKEDKDPYQVGQSTDPEKDRANEVLSGMSFEMA